MRVALLLFVLASCSSVQEQPIAVAAPIPDAAPIDATAEPVACEGGETLSFWIHTLEQPISDVRDTTFGFDLDGIESDGADATGCGFKDKRSFEGEEGVDNQLEEVLASLDLGFDIASELNAALASGDATAILTVYHVDSHVVDECVDLELQIYGDIPAQHVQLMRGTIRGGVVETDLGFIETVIPMPGYGAPVDLTFDPAKLRFTITEEGIEGGVLGAAVPVEELMIIIETVAFPEYVDLAQLVLQNNADMPYEGEDCSAVSAALSFHATPGAAPL